MHRAFLSLQAIGFFASILFLNIQLARAATSTLVPPGAAWKYLDNGSNQGTAWRAPAFNDSGWASGLAELGYGDGGEATVVSFGPEANNKYITTYFRHSFNVNDAASFTSLSLRVVRDDGVVVYLNGTEVYRNNMPSGTISYNTVASAAIGGADESAFQQANVSPALLVEGVNVLAVELHQANATSTDISFNLELTGERPTVQITLNGPANGATGMSLSPTLDVTVSHRNPEASGMTVTFYGRPAPPVGPDFTLVALPDTQFYSSSLNGGTPQIFVSQTEWVLANLQTRNIVFTTHLGDIVQNGDNGGNDLEWRNATNALYRLEDPVRTSLPYGLPYGLVVGNHDQSPIGSATGTTTFYNQYFGVSRFSGRPYYGGHFGNNNDEHFELFSASGLDFIIIHLEYDTGMTTNSAELVWANELLYTYSSRQAIVVSHHIVNTGNPATFSPQGQAIYNALKHHPNLFLMLCGHVCGEGRRTDVFNGTVYSLLSDYQCRTSGGDGWLRILEFSPVDSVIRVRTYSPTLNQFETDADSQFDLYYDMKSLLGNAYTSIAVNSGVPSGSSTTATWPGLAISTDYEWYVAVSDGVETVTSPLWRFRTADQTVPLAPAALTATAQSSTEILLAWIDNANNEAGFEIYQSVDGVNFSSIGTVGPDATGTVVTGLLPSTTYYYVVRAFNDTGFSADSNIASATTLAPPPPPAAPSGVSASPASDTQVTLSWTDNATNELGFRIERSTDGVSFNEVGAVTANVTVFSDTGLTPFTLYYYRVRAYNSVGNSGYSEVATVTTQPPPPPPAPTALTAVAGDRSVTLTWDESPGATRYFLYRSEVAGGPYALWAYGIFSLNWVDNNVTPHVTYFYVVTAANDNPQESPYSNEASATPYALPAAPTDATVAAADFHTLALTWTDNAIDETGYRIERSLDNNNFTLIATLPVDSIVHWDEGLADNTTYYYRIKAFNADGESSAATTSGTTAALPANPPGNLAAAVVSSSQINLTWTDNATNENGFKIERSDDGGLFTQIAILGLNATSYSNTGLTPAATYTYRVRAFNPAGDSAFAEATATTLPLPPSAPSGLMATAISSSQIDLDWTDTANNEDGFKIERALDAGAFVQIAIVGANGTAFSDSGLGAASAYTYRLRAFNSGGDSDFGNSASATTLPNPPAAPTGLSATAGDGQVSLSWSATQGASTYIVKRSQTPADPNPPVIASGLAQTGYLDPTVINGSTYYYVVSAVNPGGESPNSAEVSATPRANAAPTANVDFYNTAEDTPLTVAAPGVLANDIDPEGTTLTAVWLSGPANGILTFNANGSFIYSPGANFNGSDTFTYKAGDGSKETTPATVTISVNAVNDPVFANNDSATTQQGGAVTINVLANDTDIDGDALTVAAVTQGSAGTVTINANNSVTYRPAGSFSGEDTFTYTATDGAATSIAAVTVTVNKIVLFSDGFESGNFAVGGWSPGLQASVDGSAAHSGSFGALMKKTASITKTLTGIDAGTLYLSYWRRVNALQGSEACRVEISHDGQNWVMLEAVTGTTAWGAATFEIVPNGPTFHLRFSLNGNQGSDVAMVDDVEITAAGGNSAPVAQNDAYSTTEDNALTVAAAGVLSNDSDPEGDPITAVLVASASSGTVTLNANGSFTYTPNPNFNGTDSFSYKASDGGKQSAAATVTIVVAAVNDAPLANADAYAMDKDTTLTVAAPGVLGNDNDADGNPLTASLQTMPVNGTLTLNADGSLSYTPTPGFSGTDSFTYAASDGQGGSATASVTITINRLNSPPTATADAYSINEDSILTIAAPGVLANDTDPEGSSLSAILVSSVSSGVLTLNANGSFTYTPNANFNGSDAFTYKASDGVKESAVVTVAISVLAVNDAPAANADAYNVNQDTILTIAAPGVLGNDSDADGNSLTANIVSGPANGSLTLNANGSFTYTPNAGFTGTDLFIYAASDGLGGIASATVSITVNPTTPTIHVQDITMTLEPNGNKYRGLARILVHNNNENPQASVQVVGDWYFGVTLIQAGVAANTDGSGNVTFRSPWKPARSGDVFTFKVKNLILAGYSYNTAANTITENSVTIP